MKEREDPPHFSLVKFDWHINGNLLPQLIACYQNVFADPPWNEWVKCNHCGKYWGKQDLMFLRSINFKCCGKRLVKFWPKDVVENDIRHEINSSASCWLALNTKGKIIGFCWGYPITLEKLEEKLGIQVVDPLREHFGIKSHEKIAYQDEIGVLATYRGKKIAKQMFKNRLIDFLKQSLKVGVVRTREAPEPSVTFLWFTQKLGYHIIAKYPEEDGRVILARELPDLLERL
jgi:GNAT superfamily N-acetyltransferase